MYGEMQMSRNVSLVLVLTIMSVCAAKQLSVEETVSSESLEEDRSSIILYRLRELIEAQSSGSRQDAPRSARIWATWLRQTVWEYNVESANMCMKGLTTRISCLPALDPPWLTESPKTSPTKTELERRAEWVQEHAIRLWDAACEDFKKSHPNPDDYMGYCSIE
jgi:hypothetical protein